MNDAWDVLGRGENLTFWCMGRNTASQPVESRKRPQDKDKASDNELEVPKNAKKLKQSKLDERKALAEEYETKLKENHGDSYTRFQYKLWAEMLAAGVHVDLNTPPAASMFGREKRIPARNTSNDVSTMGDAMAGMVSILSQALSPNLRGSAPDNGSGRALSSTLSLMNSAELRSIYLKQMGELRQLYDAGTLSDTEYEEQRLELVESAQAKEVNNV